MFNSSTRLRAALSYPYCSYKERIKERFKTRKGLTITNDHEWTVEQLQAHEKAIKKAMMAKRSRCHPSDYARVLCHSSGRTAKRASRDHFKLC
jgi:hypothetical protein